jgi:DNA-binding NarL/FixJ family response regulator
MRSDMTLPTLHSSFKPLPRMWRYLVNASANSHVAAMPGQAWSPGPRTASQTLATWPHFLTGQIEDPVTVIAIGDAGHLRSVVVPELTKDPRTLLLGCGETERHARAQIRDKSFGVALIDLQLQDADGFELISYAKKVKPRCEVIVLADSDRREDALHALDRGATGFLVKGSWLDSIVLAVLQVANGGVAISPTVLRRLLVLGEAADRGAEQAGEAESGWGHCKLSSRECEVLRNVAAGLTSGEIAQRLSIRHMTVDTHMKHIAQKLQTHTRAQAVSRAKRWGLI